MNHLMGSLSTPNSVSKKTLSQRIAVAMTFFFVILIIFVAGIVQGLTGFGAALVALPLLALVLPMIQAVPLISLVGFCMTLQMIPELRGNVLWKPAVLLIAASLPGLALGTHALRTVSPSLLSGLLGAMILAFSLFSLRRKGRVLPLGTISCIAAGFMAGWLNGAISAGGPPAIAYASLQPWSKDEIKATLLAFFIVASASTVISYVMAGLYTASTLQYFGASVPGLVFGVWIGRRWYGGMSSESYRRLVCYMLLLMGIISLSKPVLE